MRKAGGNWVDGDRFFDREAEVEALIERVRDGRHTLLTAQRRMGKTSLVRETLRRLKEEGEVEPLFVDLEDAMAPEDVVAEIAAQTLSVQGRWLPICCYWNTTVTWSECVTAIDSCRDWWRIGGVPDSA